jgi:plasmid replication initiation protein
METKAIKCMPVVEDGKFVGIVSRADFLTALAGVQQFADDAGLRARIVAHLDAMPWRRPSIVDAAVRSGVAELTGFCDSDAQRRAVRIVVEGTPGPARSRTG